MAQFSGTVKEFKHYIGPHLRNVVQQITRKQKNAIGACQRCGADGVLDAAHIHGRDRTDIINLLLGTSESGVLVNIDLKEFEDLFKREHNPVEKAILVLCKSCHREYDEAPTTVHHAAPAVVCDKPADCQPIDPSHDVLPIFLSPTIPEDFKARLLESHKAIMDIFYSDGSIDQKPWDASRFSKSSNVFGNLRSRPEFRRGEWQRRGIVKVNVRVV